MSHSKEELLETLARMRDLPVLVVGDLILDRYIWGSVERISPEAPVPVVQLQKTEDRLGGAGNVVRNLRRLGVKAHVCGFVGNDDEGKTILGLLENEEVSTESVLVDRGRPTSVKTRVIAHSQQVVRIDRERKGPREVPLREGLAAMADAHVEGVRGIIVSDYGKGTVSSELMTRLSAGYDHGRVGLGSRPLVIDPHPENYSIYRRVSVAKPNRKEAESASGMKIVDLETGTEAARKLLDRWDAELVMITLGEDGLLLLGKNRGAGLLGEDDEKALHLHTRAVEVFDVSGAGDTVTALFTGALAAGASPSLAGELANIGAGVVVAEVGTVAITDEAMRAAIEGRRRPYSTMRPTRR